MKGDEIFQLKDHLMHPYSETRSGTIPRSSCIQLSTSRARCLIENCFGILVAQGEIFRKPIHADKD